MFTLLIETVYLFFCIKCQFVTKALDSRSNLQLIGATFSTYSLSSLGKQMHPTVQQTSKLCCRRVHRSQKAPLFKVQLQNTVDE